MRTLKFILSLIVLLLVIAAFCGVQVRYTSVITWYQAGPAAIAAVSSDRLAWVPAVAILLLTVLFGRFFCEVMCPLGTLQNLVGLVTHFRTRVRRVCTRLPVSPRQWVVRLAVLVVFLGLIGSGFAGIAGLIEPYSIFGRALLLSIPAVIVLFVILALTACGLGRVWCNWVCPVGTVLSVLAKIAPFGNRLGKNCARCRRCLEKTKVAEDSQPAVSRREAIHGVLAAVTVEKLTDGGYAPVSLPGEPTRERMVLPPGAVSRTAFSRACIACGLCQKVCPEKIIRPSTQLATLGQPVLDFRSGYCLSDCVRCSSVCPTDALRRIPQDSKADCHIGWAVWKKDLCVRTTTGDACTACVRKCPYRAVRLVGGFPSVNRDLCTGCGACEHVCPARPMPAIFVEGFDEPRRALPMDEADLLAEMRLLLSGGASVVVAKDGVIIARESGRGVTPLLQLFDRGCLRGTRVVDKVIGRAAAALCVAGGARSVFAETMGEDARQFLQANGVEAKAAHVVPRILNRDKSAPCPMEKAVEKLEQPQKMVEALRQATDGIRKEQRK